MPLEAPVTSASGAVSGVSEVVVMSRGLPDPRRRPTPGSRVLGGAPDRATTAQSRRAMMLTAHELQAAGGLMATHRTEFEVDASDQQVWAVLVDFESYADWNPALPSIAGELREGA